MPVSASSILRNFINAVTSTLMFWVTGGISLWEAHIRWETTLRIPASLMTVSPSISSKEPALGAGADAAAAGAAAGAFFWASAAARMSFWVIRPKEPDPAILE